MEGTLSVDVTRIFEGSSAEKTDGVGWRSDDEFSYPRSGRSGWTTLEFLESDLIKRDLARDRAHIFARGSLKREARTSR